MKVYTLWFRFHWYVRMLCVLCVRDSTTLWWAWAYALYIGGRLVTLCERSMKWKQIVFVANILNYADVRHAFFVDFHFSVHIRRRRRRQRWHTPATMTTDVRMSAISHVQYAGTLCKCTLTDFLMKSNLSTHWTSANHNLLCWIKYSIMGFHLCLRIPWQHLSQWYRHKYLFTVEK